MTNGFNAVNFDGLTLPYLLKLHGWQGGTIHEALKGIKIINNKRRLEKTHTLKFDKVEVFINKNKVGMYLSPDKDLNGYNAVNFLPCDIIGILLNNLSFMSS